MKKLLALVALGLALVIFGCAGMTRTGEEPVTKETRIKCPNCGAEFKVGEGLGIAGERP